MKGGSYLEGIKISKKYMEDLKPIDIFKRDCFNKIDNLAKKIKTNIDNKFDEDGKKRLLSKLRTFILISQVDNLYFNLTGESGLENMFLMLGLSEKQAKKIKKIGLGSGVLMTVIIMLYNYLREEVK